MCSTLNGKGLKQMNKIDPVVGLMTVGFSQSIVSALFKNLQFPRSSHFWKRIQQQYWPRGTINTDDQKRE